MESPERAVSRPRIEDLPAPPEGKTGWPWTESLEPLPETMPDGSDWPRITLVTPTYGQAEFIEATIRSVLLQGYPNLEYMVLDGGSTDGTVEIIEKYERWISYWHSKPDDGQVSAINEGFDRATGEILNWLNSDDILLPGALEHVVEMRRRSPDAMAWVSACHRVEPSGRILSTIPPKMLRRDDIADWRANYFYQPSCFFPAEAWEKAGPLDRTLPTVFDADFWLRVAEHGRLVGSGAVISVATIHPGAISQSLRDVLFEETRRMQERYGYDELAREPKDRASTRPAVKKPLRERVKILAWRAARRLGIPTGSTYDEWLRERDMRPGLRYGSGMKEPSLLWINQFAVGPDEGGGTRHFEVGRELGRRGWKVRIAASDFNLHSRTYTRRRDPDDHDPVTEARGGVEFQWLWAAAYRGNDWHRVWNWISFSRSLLAWGRKTAPADVVIGSSPHLFAALAAERLARRWGVPFVFEVRDLWPESLLAVGRKKGPVYWVLAKVASYLYRRAEKIVVLARGAGKYLETHGIHRSKIVLVPNGVDVDAFSGIERPERDRFTVVYAGAHGPANGLDVVLDAADRLRDRPDIGFVLVGDGPAKPELQSRSRKGNLHNVEFRDPVPKDQMPELLEEADAGLMVLDDAPLFSYAVSPNKLFDYFAAGLPVLCNVDGEVAGMVRRAGAGELAEGGSPSDLARATVALADRSMEERRAMGQAGREWVIRQHDRPVLATRLDEALRTLLD